MKIPYTAVINGKTVYEMLEDGEYIYNKSSDYGKFGNALTIKFKKGDVVIGQVRNFFKGKITKHYCKSCFKLLKKKYYLKLLQDETGKIYKCPHCKHGIQGWIFEKRLIKENGKK